MPNPSIVAPIVSQISALIRTDGQTVDGHGCIDSANDPDQEYIYSLWGRKHFLLPVTYFPTNLVYPFTLRVTGIFGAVLYHEGKPSTFILKTLTKTEQVYATNKYGLLKI